jgi:hypothetical protein
VVHVARGGAAGELDGLGIFLDRIDQVLEGLIRRVGLYEEYLVIGDELGEGSDLGVFPGEGPVEIADDEGRGKDDEFVAVCM